MSEDTSDDRAVLDDAWSRYATYDHNANRAQKRFLRLRNWMLLVGVAATTLAIFYDQIVENSSFRPAFSDWRFFLWLPMIAMPILGSVLAAGASRLAHAADWLSLRGAAEAVKREIFRYRCQVGEFSPKSQAPGSRNHKLAIAITRITARLMDTTVLHSSLKPYLGSLPVVGPEGDDGVSDLSPEQYLQWRLGDQLSYFRSKAHHLERRHRVFQWTIAVLGGVGTLLAALGQEIWVPVSVGVATALASYLEVRNVESNLAGFNRAAFEIDNVATWWSGLSIEAKTEPAAFGSLVSRTETVLGSENATWIQQMQEIVENYAEESEGNA